MNGLLLINLGTPDAPEPGAVRRYLRQFLSDPRVLDLHPVARAILLYLIILPLRPRQSAAAYRKIWTDKGSPLLYHSRALAKEVSDRLPGWRVELGMRYGSPSIEAALRRLLMGPLDRLVVFPLYPQSSSAATGSSVEEVFRGLGRRWVVPPVTVVGAFYDDPGFLDAFAAQGRPLLLDGPDHVLFSFHGVPERHIRKADPTGRHCLSGPDCCARIAPQNQDCYRAQCHATARGLAARLGLAEGAWSTSFQSRLGRTPWIGPYTDHLLPELARNGTRRLLVFCPAFVADCLETLEEIGIRGREQFIAAGGQELRLVPSLNASPAWADAVVRLVQSVMGRG